MNTLWHIDIEKAKVGVLFHPAAVADKVSVLVVGDPFEGDPRLSRTNVTFFVWGPEQAQIENFIDPLIEALNTRRRDLLRSMAEAGQESLFEKVES